MNVLFAPDWRDGVPYQRLLAEGLEKLGVNVRFLRDYKRLLPLGRLVRARAREEPVDLLHLHWPEAYYPRKGDRWDNLRGARYPLDLTVARHRRGLVVTAHNLHTHNAGEGLFEKRNTMESFEQAQRVIAHSEPARCEIERQFGIAQEKIVVIPHGDLSVPLGPPASRAEARTRLDLDERKVVLMFGAMEPYKGIEEVIECWRTERPAADLIVVGKPYNPAYGEQLQTLGGAAERVQIRPGRLDDATLRLWLSAVDAVIFNYRTIFTSGAASLARSYGVPLLLPERLKTVDLAEPSLLVRRFADGGEGLATALQELLEGTLPDYQSATPWREMTAWPRLAELTLQTYTAALAAR